MNDREKTASVANNVSAVAAPSPEKKPLRCVPFKVRWIQITPIGPNGTEARKPTNNPCNGNNNEFIFTYSGDRGFPCPYLLLPISAALTSERRQAEFRLFRSVEQLLLSVYSERQRN